MTKADLIDGILYDAWANAQWADALAAYDPALVAPASLARMNQPFAWPDFEPDPRARTAEIFAHILFASRTWVQRVDPNARIEPTSARAAIDGLTEAWVAVLENHDPAEPIDYQTYTGAPYANTLEEIANHVVAHGAYHRGQLRELAERIGVPKLPMTDRIGFKRGS